MRKKICLRRRSGSSMVEFAAGSALLISLFSGTLQFGYAFYRYNALQNAVNAGARYAALRTYDSGTATPSTAYSDAVKNMVVYGAPSTGSTPVVPGLATSDVSVTMNFANGAPSSVTVAVSGYTVPAFFTTFRFTNKPKVTYAYQGIYSPF